jgi:NIMA (never in mitosis gene a)-related kinase
MKKVKLNTLSLKEKESALMEVRVLASINSPYIISYKDCFLESSTNTLCIIMELATGGDIMKKIQTCSR